jgi:hypothetical protein
VQAKAARLLNMTPRQIAYRILTLDITMKQFKDLIIPSKKEKPFDRSPFNEVSTRLIFFMASYFRGLLLLEIPKHLEQQ